MQEMFESVPEGNRFLLIPEAVFCFDYRDAGCRIILAVGQELDPETGEPVARHGLALREETVAALVTCLNALVSCQPTARSHLAGLKLDWGDESAGDEETEPEDGAFLGQVLDHLDHLRRLAPVGLSPLSVGENPDDV